MASQKNKTAAERAAEALLAELHKVLAESMLADLKTMLEKRDFEEGNTSTPGDFVVERAFVEK